MTFLNPTMLWGLLALSVPIIVHFFNLQRPKKLLFSNVAFVKEVKKTVVKRVQFKQWLLLIARLLAVAAIVIAFANPVIINDVAKLTQGSRSVAIVIDNSYSMTAGNDRGDYLHQAQSLAKNIIGAYSEKDEFVLMTTANPYLGHSFSDKQAVLTALKDLKIKQNVRKHADFLGFSDKIFAHANNLQQELYVISDFQHSTMMADSQQNISLTNSNLSIKYIPLATRKQKNIYVESNQVISQIIEKGKPVEMKMVLVNDGEDAVKEIGVQVLLNGKVAAISSQELAAASSKEITLSFTPNESGWLSGSISLDDYPNEFDNRRYFTLYVPDKEKVLVVEGQASPNLRVLYQTLFSKQFDTKFISNKEISNAQFSDYKSVVMIGINDISSGLADKLKSYLEKGGSVMYFPADNMNIEGVNSFFRAAKIGSFKAVESLGGGKLAKQVDLSHPIFQGVFAQGRKENRGFDAPTVFRYHPFVTDNSVVHNRIMAFENGMPFMLESRVGGGLVYTFTAFPAAAWTDFAIKTSFAPIIFRATQMMNQTQNVQMGQSVGAYTPLTIRTTNTQDLIKLRSETKDTQGQFVEFIPEQYAQNGATVLKFDKLDIKEGNYDVVQGDSLFEKVAFNIADAESHLAYSDESDLRSRLDDANLAEIAVLPPKVDTVAKKIQVEKDGISLWKWFILLALLCLIAEILLLKWKE